MPQHPPRPLLAALAALSFLSGCSHAPSGTPADTVGVVAPAWRAGTAASAPVWPSAEWWTGFHSPELNALIARARTDNFDILAAVARIRQADAALVSAGAPLLPTVSATAPGPVEPQLGRPLLPAAGSTGGAMSNRYYEYPHLQPDPHRVL